MTEEQDMNVKRTRRPRGYYSLRQRLLRAIKHGYKGPDKQTQAIGYNLRDGKPVHKTSMSRIEAALNAFDARLRPVAPVAHSSTNGDQLGDPEWQAMGLLLNLHPAARKRVIDYVTARLADTE